MRRAIVIVMQPVIDRREIRTKKKKVSQTNTACCRPWIEIVVCRRCSGGVSSVAVVVVVVAVSVRGNDVIVVV